MSPTSANPPQLRNESELDSRERKFLVATLSMWCAVLVGACVLIAIDPVKRSVTPVYHEAATNWHLRHDLYAEALEFNYLPQFVFVFGPFHMIPAPVGDMVWRIVSVSVLVLGMHGLVRLIRPRRAGQLLFWATVVSMPACLAAIRNGQSTTLMTGLMMIAASQLAQRRWWSATAGLVLAIAAKPLAVVMLMLMPLVYRPTLWRAIVLVVVLAALPFVVARSEYVLGQFGDLRSNLAASAAVTENRFADLNGIMRSVGHELPPGVMRVIDLIAAAATALLWRFGARCLAEPGKALYLLGLAASYLMIFNPMNESNTYLLLAAVGAVIGLWCIAVRNQTVAGAIMLTGIVLIGVLPEPLRRMAPHFSLWFKPATAMVFAATLIWSVFARKTEEIDGDLKVEEIRGAPPASAASAASGMELITGRVLRAR